MIAVGKDPSREKQQARHQAKAAAANTFGEIAQEYIDKRRREGLATSTADKSEYYISRLGPAFARLPISSITAPEILAVLRRIEATGNYETARRVLQLSSRVFRYAMATARLTSDPSRDLRGALTAPTPKHYGAIVEPKKVGELLRAIHGYEGHLLTKLAMQLSAYVFVRPGELRKAEWAEVDRRLYLDHLRPKDENAQSSHPAPVPASGRCSAGRPRHHGSVRLCFPLHPHPVAADEREHGQRGPSPPRLHRG